MLVNMAYEMAGIMPGHNWSSRFVDRHRDVLDSKFLDTLDLARHKSGTRSSVQAYFNTVEQKIEEYGITFDNVYNMDEKGFMVGHLQKTKRIFTKDSYTDQDLIRAGQDGNREWITVLATICADSSALTPTLIYKAKTGNLQNTWLDGFDPDEDQCTFSSSLNGWTTDAHGLAWLNQVFEPETKIKAGRGWRLLFVDGHGSHLNMKFLDRCRELKIMLAIYPPRSTHILQPLDVSCFNPLANYYSQGLNELINKTAGFTSIKKRNFFAIFKQAWSKTFVKDTISSAWSKTGIWPQNSRIVLDKLPEDQRASNGVPLHGKRKSMSLLEDMDSPRKVKKLRAKIEHISTKNNTKDAKTIHGLLHSYESLKAENTVAKHELSNMAEALKLERGQNKRSKKTIEQIRSETEAGHIIFTPKRIQRYMDLEQAKEQAKEQVQVDKQIKKVAAIQTKQIKEAEAQERRNARALAAANRGAEKLQKEIQKQAMKSAKEAQKKADLAAKAAHKTSRASLKIETPRKRRSVIYIEHNTPEPIDQTSTRSGRIVKQSARLRSSK